MELLNGLNPQQLEGVTHTEGPLLILAGAGSGKTRVITYRVAYLIQEKGVHPAQILAVTFTHKAAEEMKSRVVGLLGDTARRVWISTFHSACVRILRREIGRFGYGQDFVILDVSDQSRLVKECTEELKINEELYDPKEIGRRISSLKNRLISPEAYAGQGQPFGIEDKVARVYALYQKRLKAHNGLDFDDLLVMTVRLFETYPDVLKNYQDRFRYVMIDEYQDTNHAQYRLVRLLGGHRNVCVVGDDDQSIYGFRGADLENILRFEHDYPDARVIRLEQNYRSTQNILDAAGTVVGKNGRRKAKRLWTQNPLGTPITVCQVSDEEAEAACIGRTAKNLMSENKFRYQDLAVLYRTHAQSRTLEEGLRDEGIPYRIVGGVGFYERKEIKDLLAYLKIIARPADDLSLKRILNVPPRGIGQVTIERLESCAKFKGIPLFQALNEVSQEEGLTSVQRKGVVHLAESLIELRQLATRVSLTELMEAILKRTGYEQMLQRDSGGQTGEEGRARIENVRELLSATRTFEERLEVSIDQEEDGVQHQSVLTAFLDHVALVTDSASEAGGTSDAVLLMTFHGAKGLEFPVVFMAGMEEGLFPHQSALRNQDELEEERRLCYVGMTRARQMLYMIHAEQRRLYGSMQWNSPSRFIGEIPTELVKEVLWQKEAAQPSNGRPIGKRLSNANAPDQEQPPGSLKVGLQVAHPVWGIGRIQKSEGHGEDQRVVVHFRSVGSKKLAVKFARLERVE